MAPLIAERSLQARFLVPIAITLSFGLVVGALIILFLVPALLGIADDTARGWRAYLRLAGLSPKPVGRPQEMTRPSAPFRAGDPRALDPVIQGARREPTRRDGASPSTPATPAPSSWSFVGSC